MRHTLLGAGLLAWILTGCGGGFESEDPSAPSADGGGGADADPHVAVVLRATTAPFPHDDALASQTATAVRAGVRSLELIDEAGESWVVFDATPGNVEVGYDDGTSSELTRLDLGEVRPGRYVRGRMVQDWSRLEVQARLHEAGASTDGVLRILQVTSDGALVEGASLPFGHFEHTFVAPQRSESFEGVWELASHTTTAEAEAFVEDGSWAVYFPLDLEVPADEPGTIEIEVNMDHAFRWEDAPVGVNAPGVYDIAPPLYEAVQQFGGNRFVGRWVK